MIVSFTESRTKWQLTMSYLIETDIRLGVNCRIDTFSFYISPVLVSILWPSIYLSIYLCNEYVREARYKDENWRSSLVWTLLSLYIWALRSWKKTEFEHWSMTCEHVYTLKLNIYEHMYALGNVSFRFLLRSFFLLDNQLIMINDSKRCWSIKKLVGHTNNLTRKNRMI